MRTFYIFRTNLKILENYHAYDDIISFKKNCWDFYLLMGLYYLEKGYFDKVVVWRLLDETKNDIIFKIDNNRQFIQRWVNNFEEVFNYPKTHITFFRGGFPEYCNLTKKNPEFFGLKLYLGASKRFKPVYGGIYDLILVESDNELKIKNSLPFYKTANPYIFKPLNNIEKKYDLCWIVNFSQITQKGQEYFIEKINKSNFLSNLKIIHIGNNPEIGKKLCEKFKINNIEFTDHIDRNKINYYLNCSKFGIVTSNKKDGSPRTSTEILCSGIPLFIREETRLLNYYKNNFNVITFNDNNIEEIIKKNISIKFNKKLIPFEDICDKNLYEWLI